MRISGFTLIEVMVAVTLLAVAAFGFYAVMRHAERTQQRSNNSSQVELEVLKLQKFLRRLGRVAYRCRVPNSGVTASELHCEMDFGSPPFGNFAWVRLVQSHKTQPPQVIYEKCQTAYDLSTFTCLGPGWIQQNAYSGIDDFLVCDTDSVDSGSCSISTDSKHPDIGIRAIRTAMTTPTVPNYFRYRVGATLSSSGGRFSVQSAFSARNQTPVVAGFLFQWGD